MSLLLNPSDSVTITLSKNLETVKSLAVAVALSIPESSVGSKKTLTVLGLEADISVDVAIPLTPLNITLSSCVISLSVLSLELILNTSVTCKDSSWPFELCVSVSPLPAVRPVIPLTSMFPLVVQASV